MTTTDNRVLLSTEREYRLNSDTLFEVITRSRCKGHRIIECRFEWQAYWFICLI
jgi:hypothetical protein